MNCNFKLSIFIILVIIVSIFLGCGESSLENPVVSETNPSETKPIESTPVPDSALEKPTVTINISKSTVSLGESVKITATVSAVNSSKLILNWVNATGYGELSNIKQNSATWTAPSIGIGEVRVEVIQLIVTVISHVISVKESGVDTNTNIETVTKTIPITIID
ncbi:TPA: hypothetical protein EYP66_11190 [Candidatus Poribacteria bacterium]|nr:hypothetical protein [Candidatus Poribacteria bacterium]